jgi:hypothetical protein
MTTKSFLGFVTDRTETPSRITRGFPPVARSHTRTVESQLPLTTIGRPSSSPTATAVTPPVSPVNGSPSGSPLPRSPPEPSLVNERVTRGRFWGCFPA